MTSISTAEFRLKLNRATELAHGWLDRHAIGSKFPEGDPSYTSALEVAFLLWRHARGNTALREALLLRGCLSVARNALRPNYNHVS